jgi:hypothetical protein
MKFRFDIDKSIASTAYLIRKQRGALNVLPLVKALYHANRASLVRYGRSITGDRLISMKSGPNVSETYDLINGTPHAKPEHLVKWQKYIARKHNTMQLIPDANPNIDCLSGREMRLLDDALAVVCAVKGRIDEWSHRYFPEWEKPTGLSQSTTIDPKRILEIEQKTPEEIEDIEGEIESVNWLRSIAG